MPRRIAAKITGVAGYVPPRKGDYQRGPGKARRHQRRMDPQRTGIRERHIAEKGTATSHLATEAAKTLLAQTNTDPAEIDLIVIATVTPDMFFPATACLVQNRIGAKNAWGFDFSAACSGFAYALTVGAQFVGAGTHKKVLVIGSDAMTSILDYKDRATCVLFGDGAGAVLLEAAESERRHPRFRARRGRRRRRISLHARRRLPESQPPRKPSRSACTTSIRRVSKFSNTLSGGWPRWPRHLLERNGFTNKDLALLVPHQANLRIIRAMQERLGVEDSKVMVNIDRYGNTTAGTIPLGLRDAVERGSPS